MSVYMFWYNLGVMTYHFFRICDRTYNMIVNNRLILAFVLMCAIFVGLSLLKRLIHIN